MKNESFNIKINYFKMIWFRWLMLMAWLQMQILYETRLASGLLLLRVLRKSFVFTGYIVVLVFVCILFLSHWWMISSCCFFSYQGLMVVNSVYTIRFRILCVFSFIHQSIFLVYNKYIVQRPEPKCSCNAIKKIAL